MDKKQVSDALDQIAVLLELQGENPFKTRAYHNAAQIIRGLTEDIASYVEQNSLTSIKGIGQGLSFTITELVKTGDSKIFKDLRRAFPQGVIEMLRIPGLGPKKIKILFEKLKIKSIDELKKACETHKLQHVDGFGLKTEENILQGIDLIQRTSDKHLYPTAKNSADKILSTIKGTIGVLRCEYAGSLRRKKELIGDIDILVSATTKSRKDIFKVFAQHEEVEKIIAQGDTKSTGLLKNGIQCDVRIVAEDEYPFALQYFTGSKEHNVSLRTRAKKFGWSLNEYGFSKILHDKKSGKLPQCKTEEDIYKALGLKYIPPELRENNGEIELAEKEMPTLITESDLNGTFHCHTNFSDGVNSLEEMVKAAQKLNWKFLGIGDHSQAAAYAGGMKIDKAERQIELIDSLNKKLDNFKIFKGIECDILPNGLLDYPDSLLKKFNYVVVSIHSKFKMTEIEATKRVIKAMENRYATILGHPTGRLLLERDGYPLNMKEVIDAIASLGKSIEINAHPMRLDLDWRWVRYAKDKGVPICINPDAHNIEGLQDVAYGVGIARKGWLESKDVINAWQLKEIESFFNKTKN